MRPLFMYDLPSVFAEQIRSAEAESGRMYEPVIGIVTDNKDPDKRARVKVKIPVLSEDETTWWAPIVMLGAGKNRGWFFIPEIDDEVLILFEHGDMNHPLVVGALWNGKDKPPSSNADGKNALRVIKSRAGSKITFDDDKNQVTIEDGEGTGKITFAADDNLITIEALTGDVCLQAPTGDMQIAASEAEWTASDKLEIHAGAAMALGTDASAEVNGAAGLTLSGATGNANCGKSSMPSAPSPSPADVADPYGS